MAFPTPVPGLVIRYSYLWADEYARGREEGSKDRPCAIILATADEDGEQVVTVLPITHSPPANLSLDVEIPPDTKRRLGLDDARSWVILGEANRFIWPGPDVRPQSGGDSSSVAYGPLPFRLYETIRLKFIAILKARMAKAVPRTDWQAGKP